MTVLLLLSQACGAETRHFAVSIEVQNSLQQFRIPAALSGKRVGAGTRLVPSQSPEALVVQAPSQAMLRLDDRSYPKAPCPPPCRAAPKAKSRHAEGGQFSRLQPRWTSSTRSFSTWIDLALIIPGLKISDIHEGKQEVLFRFPCAVAAPQCRCTVDSTNNGTPPELANSAAGHRGPLIHLVARGIRGLRRKRRPLGFKGVLPNGAAKPAIWALIGHPRMHLPGLPFGAWRRSRLRISQAGRSCVRARPPRCNRACYSPFASARAGCLEPRPRQRPPTPTAARLPRLPASPHPVHFGSESVAGSGGLICHLHRLSAQSMPVCACLADHSLSLKPPDLRPWTSQGCQPWPGLGRRWPTPLNADTSVHASQFLPIFYATGTSCPPVAATPPRPGVDDRQTPLPACSCQWMENPKKQNCEHPFPM